MNLSTYITIIVMFIVFFLILRTRIGKAVIGIKIIKKSKMEDNTKMIELAKRFIGKVCLIYAFDSNHQFQGTIKEVSNGAILVENSGTIEAINLDFVIRIREYPKSKNRKKKSLVLD